MRLEESATLVAEARAIYPGMSIVPGIADAWLGVLGDLTLDECRVALLKHGKGENRMPVPADIRRLALAARQDAALRALPNSDRDLIPMPDWFHTTVQQHKLRTREANKDKWQPGRGPMPKQRADRAEYGQTVMRPSDGRPGW